MSSVVYINPDDLNKVDQPKTAIAIESAAVGRQRTFLRAKSNGKLDPFLHTDNDTIGFDLAFIAEPVSGGRLHIGSQMTLRSAHWKDRYLHVTCDGPGLYTVSCKVREQADDPRSHFYFVRLKAESNALSIGSVGCPGRFIAMNMEKDEDGTGGVVSSRVGYSNATWFYLTPVKI
ncbi:hypothetical protein HYALB_00009636 [Hymenoscyphus albidus]|uniref:Uncharacterized protein n=1 Tax=Hymenoscyphus albidus TaxID=595503 RepID=A0A9N9LLT3_9HELO|nr:hypothetical protein HYALB_00009636 [Hymenoscyphus albidus]